MKALATSLVLRLDRRLDLPRERAEEELAADLDSLLSVLRDWPGIRLAVSADGPCWAGLSRSVPALVQALAALVGEGVVEVLGGGWSEPVLSALSRPEAAWQLHRMGRFLEGQLGAKPAGAWLPLGAWDPVIPEVLVRAGYAYALLPSGALEAAGVPPRELQRVWLTERTGACLRLLPMDMALVWECRTEAEVPAMVELLSGHSLAGADAVAWMVPVGELGRRMVPRALAEWLDGLFRTLATNDHWIKLDLPSGTVAQRSASGPVYISSWLPERWRECAVAPGLEAVAPGFEAFLGRYSEANRIHKRALFAAGEVLRLRRAARRPGPDREALAQLAERASLALAPAFAADIYAHGPREGLYSPRLRRAVHAAIAEAEWLALRAMRRDDLILVERRDLDCDGEDELLVRTPHLAALLRPAHGGALVELDLWELPGNLLDVVTRRRESYHDDLSLLPALVAGDAEPVEPERVDDDDTEEGGAVVAIEDEDDDGEVLGDPALLSARLRFDRRPRASFVDRFLGPETTLENLRRGQHPEMGDFHDARYQVLSAEHEDRDFYAVTLAREGRVRQEGARGIEGRLVRVSKRLVFHRALPVVEAHYEIGNRYHEPIQSRFAVELNLGPGLDGPLAVEGSDPSPGRAATQEDVRVLVLADPASGLRVQVAASPAARVQRYPVECVVRVDGGFALEHEGTCLVLSWPVALWGEERLRIDVALSASVERG